MPLFAETQVMASLLAVDLGLKTGLVLYGDDGRVRWYRSRNYGTADRLRRRVHTLLGEIPDLTHVVLEGGGPLAVIWQREAGRRGLAVKRISAEQWRDELLYPREQRGKGTAKRKAGELARHVVEWSGAARPTSLRHDAAEAILIGLYAVLDLGWLDRPPPGLRNPSASPAARPPADR